MSERRARICPHGHRVGVAYDGDWTLEVSPEDCPLCPKGELIRYKDHDMKGNPIVRGVVSSFDAPQPTPAKKVKNRRKGRH